MSYIKKLKRALAAAAATVLVMTAVVSVPAGAAVNNNNVFPVESNAWKDWPQAPDIKSGTGIVMDAKTGTVLYDKGMDDQRYPASITKIMTTLIALENAPLDTPVTFTATGMADAYAGSSNINPVLGETFNLEQCLYMIMLKSANDVATQVAEVVGGSVASFVDKMNAKAAEIGAVNTHFSNASGLFAADHYTSAHDMALITQEALKNTTFTKIASTCSYTVPATNMSAARTYQNHHVMMNKDDHTYYYDGCFGGKTGFTDESRNTLVTFVNKNNLELIVVIMYSPDGVVMFQDTKLMLDYVYTNFKLGSKGELMSTGGDYVVDGSLVKAADYEKKLKAEQAKKKAADTAVVSKEETDGTQAIGVHAKSAAGKGVAYVAIVALALLIAAGTFGIVLTLKKNKDGKNEPES